MLEPEIGYEIKYVLAELKEKGSIELQKVISIVESDFEILHNKSAQQVLNYLGGVQ